MAPKKLANFFSQPSLSPVDTLVPVASAALTSRGGGFSHDVKPVALFQ
jgi:hypothetical protein